MHDIQQREDTEHTLLLHVHAANSNFISPKLFNVRLSLLVSRRINRQKHPESLYHKICHVLTLKQTTKTSLYLFHFLCFFSKGRFRHGRPNLLSCISVRDVQYYCGQVKQVSHPVVRYDIVFAKMWIFAYVHFFMDMVVTVR